MLEIKETTKSDLTNVKRLWANGEVMNYVGFPNGYHLTLEQLENWLERIVDKPKRCHYSIYNDGIYCGETYYSVDELKYAQLDIKLLPEARGQGIATLALSFAINQAFSVGEAEFAYVDPHKDNVAAWKLYEKLGFIPNDIPSHIDAGETYLEIQSREWKSR